MTNIWYDSLRGMDTSYTNAFRITLGRVASFRFKNYVNRNGSDHNGTGRIIVKIETFKYIRASRARERGNRGGCAANRFKSDRINWREQCCVIKKNLSLKRDVLKNCREASNDVYRSEVSGIESEKETKNNSRRNENAKAMRTCGVRLGWIRLETNTYQR